MRAYIYDGGADEAAAVAAVVEALHARTRRNQLVLFTAHERLRRARARLLERLPAGAMLLAQEWDGPASQVSERFRDRTRRDLARRPEPVGRCRLSR